MQARAAARLGQPEAAGKCDETSPHSGNGHKVEERSDGRDARPHQQY